ncbi:hypothetical protein SGPA1_21457 [Streptomyces misionensis JCM 4497]
MLGGGRARGAGAGDRKDERGPVSATGAGPAAIVDFNRTGVRYYGNVMDSCPLSKGEVRPRPSGRTGAAHAGLTTALGRAAQPRAHPGGGPRRAVALRRGSAERHRPQGGRRPGHLLPQLPQPRGTGPGDLPPRDGKRGRQRDPAAGDDAPRTGPARLDGPALRVRDDQGRPGRRDPAGHQHPRRPGQAGAHPGVRRGRAPAAGRRGGRHHPARRHRRGLAARHSRPVAARPARGLAAPRHPALRPRHGRPAPRRARAVTTAPRPDRGAPARRVRPEFRRPRDDFAHFGALGDQERSSTGGGP